MPSQLTRLPRRAKVSYIFYNLSLEKNADKPNSSFGVADPYKKTGSKIDIEAEIDRDYERHPKPQT